VQLDIHLDWPGADAPFTRGEDRCWRLTLAAPAADRIEYRLRVTYPDGTDERVLDPGVDRVAPGPFGDKSELRLPAYVEPAWVGIQVADGQVEHLEVRCRGLGAAMPVAVWSPSGAQPGAALPLLVAHDGPEFATLALLLRYVGAAIDSGQAPPCRVALLHPVERDEWYAANGRYSTALVRSVLPALRRAAPVAGRPVAMGASLGGLSILHAQRRYPGELAGMFLQSGSFFDPDYDAHESNFAHYGRVVRFVGSVQRAAAAADPVPTVLTYGTAEENRFNNLRMAEALRRQGYPVTTVPWRDGHTFTGWRDAFHPGLAALLATAWGGEHAP
jgi:enterochelin esterase-like enzyme